VVSTLFTVFGGPGIILVYLPLAITRFHLPTDAPAWQCDIAIGLILLGLVPLLESIVRFVRAGSGTLMPQVPTERLVVSGLYRWVRNPMYVGDLIVLVGEALLFRNAWMLGYAVAVWLTLDTFIRRYEEPTLGKRYGTEYAVYCQAVKRWRPRLRPLA